MTDRDKLGYEAAKKLHDYVNKTDLMSKELHDDVMRLIEAKDAEIERLKALWREVSMHSDSASTLATENAKLRAVVDAAHDYMWCIGDPPAHDMARTKLKKALAVLETEK
jgi:hypothetical protein